jgi:hypothetical protein
VPNADDCDDTTASIRPGAPETENGTDDDCDGTVDEGTAAFDDDGDGWSENASDCDDADPLVGLPPLWYRDRDEDGHGDAGAVVTACTAPSGFVAPSDDCDDRNADKHPGVVESCTSPLDLNCDGSVGYADLDGDRWPACEECDDADAEVNPSRVDFCGDGIDQNCDGVDAVCPPDTDLPAETDLAEETDETGETSETDTPPPVCDSDDAVIAYAGGWSCDSKGSAAVSLLGLGLSLLLFRRRKP